MRLLRPLVEANPSDGSMRMLLSQALEGLSRPGEALEVIERTLSRGDAVGLRRAAELAQAAGRPRDEVVALKAVGALEPNNSQLWARVAELEFSADNPREGAAALDRYLALEPLDAARWDQLASARHALGHVVDEAAALEQLKSLTNHASVRERLGLALERRGHTEAAATELLAAHELDRSSGTAGWAFVRLALELDRLDDAGRVLRELIVRPDPLPVTRERVSEMLAESGDLDGAARALRPAAEAPGADRGLLIRYGELLLEAERVDEGALVLERALDSAPADRDVGFVLAQAYLAQQRYFAARVLIERAVQAQPELLEDALELWLDYGAAVLATGPSVLGEYAFGEDSNGYTKHGAVVGLRHQPLEWLGYLAAYTYAYHSGPSLIEGRGQFTLEAHGALAGLSFYVAPRSSLHVLFAPRSYLDGPVFVGTRIEFRQTAQLPLDFRLWLEREQDGSTVDALEAETVRYRLASRAEFELLGQWRWAIEGGYDHMIHTEVPDQVATGTRLRNDGAYWEIATGVGFDLAPVSLEVMAEYAGLWYRDASTVSGSRIPYFAPQPYQTFGLPISVLYDPHWRVSLDLALAPRWLLEDQALQLGYGAGLTFLAHPQHRFELRYDRTDTLVGSATRPFQENVLRFSYTGAF